MQYERSWLDGIEQELECMCLLLRGSQADNAVERRSRINVRFQTANRFRVLHDPFDILAGSSDDLSPALFPPFPLISFKPNFLAESVRIVPVSPQFSSGRIQADNECGAGKW
jgi:hypothetical protein